MPSAEPDAILIARFREDLARLLPSLTEEGRLGLAVSGGPDSIALLLLAHDTLPDRIAAATVDHGLRPEAAAEARFVAELCADRGIPHATLVVTVADDGGGHSGLGPCGPLCGPSRMGAGRGLAALATAHHADDQAETLLMRLARGAGLAGLAGVRALRRTESVPVVRPLLGWRKAELVGIVESAGILPVADPSNADPRYDRTAARTLMAGTDWLDPARLARVAAHLAEAEGGAGLGGGAGMGGAHPP